MQESERGRSGEVELPMLRRMREGSETPFIDEVRGRNVRTPVVKIEMKLKLEMRERSSGFCFESI